MAIPVKLEVFEGPLDLLLHLIEKNKVDIYDIPIVEITEQYLDYIRQMQHEDMNVMSEFLVMAATLIDIKCRMLLPKEVNEEGEEEDPRAELVEKLLEYKMYKYMSFELKDRLVDAAKSLYREAQIPKEVAAYKQPVDYEALLGGLTLSRLHEIFKSVMKRQEEKIDPIRSNYGNIEKDEVDMDQKALYVELYARSHKTFSFRGLLGKQRSKMEVIVTFLVILEMMKTGDITIFQENIGDDILITSNVADEDLLNEEGEESNSSGVENKREEENTSLKMKKEQEEESTFLEMKKEQEEESTSLEMKKEQEEENTSLEMKKEQEEENASLKMESKQEEKMDPSEAESR